MMPFRKGCLTIGFRYKDITLIRNHQTNSKVFLNKKNLNKAAEVNCVLRQTLLKPQHYILILLDCHEFSYMLKEVHDVSIVKIYFN